MHRHTNHTEKNTYDILHSLHLQIFHGFKIAFFSEAFLYIRLCWANHLVGNCLFPRMAKEYNGCYILLNRITSHCCSLILGVYYNKIPPFILLDHGTFLQTPPSSREKKQVEQGAQTEPIEPATKTQAAAKWRSKAWPRMSKNSQDILGTTTVVNYYFTAKSSFGEYVVLVPIILRRSAAGKSLWIAVLVQGCIGS